MTKPIVKFREKHFFLSNFYPVIITFEGHTFFTAEHAYQAQKATTLEDFNFIRTGHGPADALHRSRKVATRSNWDDVKNEIMLNVLREKFSLPRMRVLLKETGTREIIEGNDWGEDYWGVCDGKGENMLGRLLMTVRSEI